MKFFKKLGIDLGTTNFLVWAENEGIVLNEPSIVTIDVDNRSVLVAGQSAKTMQGKTPDYIEVVRPIQGGVVADYQITEAMLKLFLKKVMGSNFFIGPEVVICVPAGVTQVEQRAVMDAIVAAGARKAYLVDKPLAAAIGAKIPVAEAFGNMIIDMGGGVTEVAVISLGGVVTHKSVKIGGNKFDEAIMDYLKKNYSLIIGQNTAEQLKKEIGSAIKLKHPEIGEISGRDSLTGLPKIQKISSEEVYEAIKPYLDVVITTIKYTLEETPAELVADIADKGIVLCGGGVQLRNFNTLITREIGVSAHVVIEPELCVVKGAGAIVENLNIYQRMIR